ncbi:molecular chaperone DnaJ [Litorivivens sp.]|uniref:molecular chaperone DnaJ n=1 Tax=Litorivivens sp. TaxID=2020868 RepID=UPI003567158D
MLIRLLLAGAVLFAIVALVRRANQQNPAERRKTYITLVVTVLAGALVLLSLTGRVHWIGALIGALLPFARKAFPLLVRLLPFLAHQRKAGAASRGATGGNQSAVDTPWLHMTMDHDSGALDGAVTQGPFAGRQLSQLSLKELKQLYVDCQSDTDSIDLLNTYLTRRFGKDWNHSQNPAGTGAMSREQALSILGLKEGASRDDVIKAHRSLMQKLHPDRGGNDYLAAQINLAKDVLLDE